MAIDLSRFSKEKIVIMPFVDGWGNYETRKVKSKTKIQDSFYSVSLGDGVRVNSPASPLEIEETLGKKKKLLGYALGGEVIPLNFENVFRLGEGETVNVNFLIADTWDIVSFVRWDDGRFYFSGIDFTQDRSILGELERRFQKEEGLEDLKGITPEQRYYYLLLTLQRQSYRELEFLEKMKLTEAERKKRIEQFQNTFAGRLKRSVENTGATLVSYEAVGKNQYVVTWKMGNETIKSTINDRMKILDLGFCASGADRKYYMDSAIMLAKTFQRESFLNITRQ